MELVTGLVMTYMLCFGIHVCTAEGYIWVICCTSHLLHKGYYTVTMPRPALIVHGGAWAIPDHMAERSVSGVKKAAREGYRVLQQGGSAVDAVETAITVMEDDPIFDAGTGSVLNSAGEVEMDASIMEGSKLNAGAVACVQNLKNPIKLARLVMEQTDHVLLVGKGAAQFAEEKGVPTVPQAHLVTEDARKELTRLMKFRSTVDVLFKDRNNKNDSLSGCDTVGAAAIDIHGNTAFGTSTGGLTAKRPGRVGDSPLIGCGGYCDNSVGGVSTTGHGESIIKLCLAKHATDLMKSGLSPEEAMQKSLELMTSRVEGSGGGVAVNQNGDVGKAFTTDRMAWASAKNNQLHYGLNHNEDFVEDIL